VKIKTWFFSLIFLVFLSACASRSPVEKLKNDLAKYPEYSVILDDMVEDGNFFKDYFHRYKVVYGAEAPSGDSLTYEEFVTNYHDVDKKEYQKYYDQLGMAIVSKSQDGKVNDVAHPPGYQYVGNPQYGTWRQDSQGNSFWEFYGKYAMLSTMMNMFRGNVYRSEWDDFRGYQQRREPYYGRDSQYGTYGETTKKTNTTFFERQKAKEAARKAQFQDKVKQRVRRSKMSTVRSRSRSFGK
jgi:hypothetical protein